MNSRTSSFELASTSHSPQTLIPMHRKEANQSDNRISSGVVSTNTTVNVTPDYPSTSDLYISQIPKSPGAEEKHIY